VNGRRGVTAAAALHLARSFEGTPESGLNLESSYDL
jgi:plasmid maintenance system antidote protein VapI